MFDIHEVSGRTGILTNAEDEASSENEDERSLSELAERMRASFDKWYCGQPDKRLNADARLHRDIDGDNEISEEDCTTLIETCFAGVPLSANHIFFCSNGCSRGHGCQRCMGNVAAVQ